jgi:hypothetical protein
MREELVPESFPLGCSLDETCDIDELDGGWNDLVTIDYCSDLFEPIIVYIDYTSIGFYGTEREVRSLSGV